MTTQTEAERLAYELDVGDFDVLTNYAPAAELRRLVSFNQQLMDEVARLNKALREALAEQPAQPFDHTAAANTALREAQSRSCQIAKAAQQEPVAELLKQSRANFERNFGKGGQGWADWIYGDIAELPSEHTSPPAKPLTEWQPIETAPKNGFRVLLYSPPVDDFSMDVHCVVIGWYVTGRIPADNHWATGVRHGGKFIGQYVHNPTHWMPLPSAPIEAAHGITKGNT